MIVDRRTRGSATTASLAGMQPVIGSEELRRGTLTRNDLRRGHRALFPDVYLANQVELSAGIRARAAWLWSDRRGVIAGRSAAALHGAKWMEANLPAELLHQNRRPPDGLRTWSDRYLPDEIVVIDGMAVTNPARTMLDLACRHSRLPAVVAMDALARATRVTAAETGLIAARYPGRRNIRPARDLLRLVDGGAESPRETRLRLLILDAGLPRPQTQVRVRDEYGQIVARVDLGWPELKIAVEYDGDQHWTDRRQFANDIRRIELLQALGWIVIRVTAQDSRLSIVGRIEEAFRCRACD